MKYMIEINMVTPKWCTLMHDHAINFVSGTGEIQTSTNKLNQKS